MLKTPMSKTQAAMSIFIRWISTKLKPKFLYKENCFIGHCDYGEKGPNGGRVGALLRWSDGRLLAKIAEDTDIVPDKAIGEMISCALLGRLINSRGVSVCEAYNDCMRAVEVLNGVAGRLKEYEVKPRDVALRELRKLGSQIALHHTNRMYNGPVHMLCINETSFRDWFVRQLLWKVCENLSLTPVDKKPKFGLKDFKILEESEEIVAESLYSEQIVRHSNGYPYTLKAFKLLSNPHVVKWLAEHIRWECNNIKHPYIAACHDSFYDKKDVYVVQDSLTGGSLVDAIASGMLRNESKISKMCQQVLLALYYMEVNHPFVYRDVNPSNILFDSSGSVQLCGVGIQAMIYFSLPAMQQVDVAEPYKYMAPEELQGKNHTSLSDVWSLGLVALECATGRYPYEGVNTFRDMLCLHSNSVSSSVSALVAPPDISEAFQSFLEACLQVDADKRKPIKDLLDHPFVKENP